MEPADAPVCPQGRFDGGQRVILKRFYDDNLAQASYLVGCPGAGEACVIDPNRDVAAYMAAAAQEGLRITAVTETHIHADYLSGSRELAALTGAKLYLSDEGDADWKYAFAHEPNVALVRHGDSFRVGGVRLDVVKTPGHTPEHISFLVTDEPSSPVPLGAFTGDFVFVGDVGRPDLLENAAGIKGTMEPGARALFQSIQEFAKNPDHLLLWPAHGSGSACGKSLGGVPVTSLGYERAANWAFGAKSEDSFVREVLMGQPDPPKYFAEMKRLNKLGPALLNGFRVPARHQDGARLTDLAKQATVLDVRPSPESLAAPVPGAVHVPLNRGFTNWAGWFVPYDTDIWIVAESEDDVRTAVRNLAMIGLDQVAGWFGPDAAASVAGAPVRSIDASGLSSRFVLDVRSDSEWNEGHRHDAVHIPLGRLPERAHELPRDRDIAVHCASGARSPIAVSVLAKLGFTRLADVSEGYIPDSASAVHVS